MCWSDRNLSGSKPEIFAATASCEICRTRAAGNLFRLIQWVTAAGVMPNASDNFLFPPRTEITSKIFTALPLTQSLNSCRIGITKCKEFCGLCTKKFTINNSKISELVITRSGLPPWKKMISMPKYLLRMGKTPSELRRWENANQNTIFSVLASPLTTEKRNAAYPNFGKYSTPANQCMQRMLAAAAITTPSVAACGATTVWANGPIAPPRSTPFLNGLRLDALNGSIGSLDMAARHIGTLVDNIIRFKGEKCRANYA